MKEVSITDYLDRDYLEYAVYVLENRAIPSVIDGLKPTQRKAIFIANRVWKTGKEKPYKVFQLTGRIAADAHYHHGDGSLNTAIINMAQKFKNSMPLLEGIGQFGTLRSPESGAPRYVSVKLHPNFRLLYKDFELLTSRWEEGSEIEPQFFLPIIPTVLLNGSSGIAVGFATNILNRNPLDLIECCLKELNGKRYNDPIPWFNGFNGTCEPSPDAEGSWIFKGKAKVLNTTTVHVTELPPSTTYEKYDSHLNRLEDDHEISSYSNNCKSNVDYTLKFSRTDLNRLVESDRLNRTLRLEEKQTENFTVLDEHGKLKVFNNPREIIKYFVQFRLGFYQKRKEWIISKLERDLTILGNKARFIKDIIDGRLKVNNIPRQKIIDYLDKNGYDQVDGSFSYLWSMAIYTLTKEKYQELLDQLELSKKELNNIKTMDPSDMYQNDLVELRSALKKEYSL
jgi:DNA topoisomerase II